MNSSIPTMLLGSLLVTVSCLAVTAQCAPRPRTSLDRWGSSYPEIAVPRITELSFQNDKEYRYIYDGQILTGLPETGNQFSGMRIRAVFSVQLRDGFDTFQIERVSMGKINEEIVGGPLSPQLAELFEELQGEEAIDFESALTKPLSFEYNKGQIINMESLESDPLWSINIKRSMIATFNLNVGNVHPVSYQGESSGRSATPERVSYPVQFTTMEEGIGGQCEATYLIRSFPVDQRGSSPNSGEIPCEILNVTKSWDYTKCRSRPTSVESFSKSGPCPHGNPQCRFGNRKEPIESAALTRYNLIGTPSNYIIQSASTEGVHKFTPYSNEGGSMTAYINASLRLVSSGPITQDHSTTAKTVPRKGLQQLLPKLSPDSSKAHGGSSTNEARELLRANSDEKKLLVRTLFARLVEDPSDAEIDPESANLVTLLVNGLRHTTIGELYAIHEEIKLVSSPKVHQEQVEKLWLDVVALTGTKPAVQLIRREILSGQLNGERAAQILNTLSFTIRQPDDIIVREYLQICRNVSRMSESEISGWSSIRQACWLGFGSLVHAACVYDDQTVQSRNNNLAASVNPSCRPESKHRFLLELFSRLKLAETEQDKLLALKSLANTGLPGMIADLKAIFSDDTQPTLIRVHAIYALWKLAKSQPEHVLENLAPEFHDQTNPYQVRIAAFEVMMEAQPDRGQLEAISRGLHTEKSVQVGSFVWSKMKSLANSTHPCYETLADDVRLALELGKPFDTGLTKSKGFHFGGFSDQLNVVGFVELSTVGEPTSVIPRSLNIRVNGYALGRSQDLFEAGFDTEGLHSLSALLKKLILNPPRTTGTRPVSELFENIFADEPASGYAEPFTEQTELDEVDQLLGLNDRPAEQDKGSAYLSIFGQQVRFFSLSSKNIKRTIKEALTSLDLQGLLSGRKAVDFRKAIIVADEELVIPTELGIPLTVDLKAPVVGSVKGVLGLKLEAGAPGSSFPEQVVLQTDVKINFATQLESSIHAVAGPLRVGAAIVVKVSTVLPINGNISFDLKTAKFASSIELPSKPVDLLKLQSTPVTTVMITPRNLVPHQRDQLDGTTIIDRSAKLVLQNQESLSEELTDNRMFRIQADLAEAPFALNKETSSPTEFYRGLTIPVPQRKTVPTHGPLKTKDINLLLGHPALGALLQVRGQVQLPYGLPAVPLAPAGGKVELAVTLKPTKSPFKTLDLSLFLRLKNFEPNAGSPEWSELFDQLTGVRQEDLVRRLESELPAGFQLSPMSGYSCQLILQGRSGTTEKTILQSVISMARGINGTFIKVVGDLEILHPKSPLQVCVSGFGSYPAEYSAEELYHGFNKSAEGQLHLAFGQSCTSPEATKLSAKITTENRKEQMSTERHAEYSVERTVNPKAVGNTHQPAMQRLEEQCSNEQKRGLRWTNACETVKKFYNSLMQVKVEMDYQNIPSELEEVLEKAERFMLATFYWNSEVQRSRAGNSPNRTTLSARLSPESEKLDPVLEREEPQQEQLRSAPCKPQTVVKYQPGNICFSIEPVLVPEGATVSEEEEYVRTRRVGFHCLSEDSSAAQRLRREASVRVLTEMSTKSVDAFFWVPRSGSCEL